MAGWFHFVLQIASVVSLFIVKPGRKALHVFQSFASEAPTVSCSGRAGFPGESRRSRGSIEHSRMEKRGVNHSWNSIR